MDIEQYKILSARRISYNNLVWQTPAIASAAQAFLLSVALNPLIKGIVPIVIAFFSFLVGLASIQLLIRHRHLERMDSDLLKKYEETTPGCSVIHGPIKDCPPSENWFESLTAWIANQRSGPVWIAVLTGFVLLGFFATCRAIWLLKIEMS
jgi:hypothetical protein